MKISSKGKRANRRALPAALAATAVLVALFAFKASLLLAASPPDGPSRLAALLAANASEISRMKTGLAAGESRPGWTRLRTEIDAAAHQKDAAWSGLYWYTSLPEALEAARREGKPVLSLRLLGRLDEELSCANSRFFRTALYANATISDELRKNWILHWESVRPAPQVTIDFGDGRVLHRTITGNSLHYVLDADGHALDVLPGLWGPEDFLRRLRGAGAEARVAPVDAAHRAGAPHEPFKESPLSFSSSSSSSSLDHDSLLLMRAKAPRMTESALNRMLVTFERTLAEDSRKNAELRARILPWLSGTSSLPALTERIYREVFLTPASDPWLGLVTPDAYAAIEGDPAPGPGGPNAWRGGVLAASKMIVERPMLAKVVPGGN